MGKVLDFATRADDPTITDVAIRHRGNTAIIPFEHHENARITDATDCFAYLCEAFATYKDSSLEQFIEANYRSLEEISHEDYLYAVKRWRLYRECYNKMLGLFDAEELELLMQIVPCI